MGITTPFGGQGSGSGGGGNISPRDPGVGLDLNGNALDVETPFLPAEKTKLQGITAGAEPNVNPDWSASSGDAEILNKPTIPVIPPHTLKFSAVDSDTTGSAIDSELGLYVGGVQMDDTNQLSQVTRIEIAFGMAAYGENAQLPDTDDDAVDTRDYFDPFIAGGAGGLFLSLYNATDNKGAYVRADSIAKDAAHSKYTLSNLSWAKSFSVSSAGESWNVAVTQSWLSIVKNSVDARDELVFRDELKPKEGTFYGSFETPMLDVARGDKRYAFCIASGDGSAAPTQATTYNGLDNVAAGSRTLVVSKTMWADAHFSVGRAVTSAELTGITYIAYSGGDSANHVKLTSTGSAVSVGSGNGAYWYIPVTAVIVGTIPSVKDEFCKIEDDVPSDIWDDSEIPWKAIFDAPNFLKNDGSNVASNLDEDNSVSQATKLLTDDFETVPISHLNEHIIPRTTEPIEIPVTWETTIADITNKNNKIGYQNALVSGNAQLKWALADEVALGGGGTIPVADVVKYFNSHHKIEVFAGSKVLKGDVTSFVKPSNDTSY